MKSFFRYALIALALCCISAPANAAAKFLVLCTTTCTWDNSNDTIWSTSSGGANNTTHPVAGDTVTLDVNSCVGGLTCTITTGAVTLAMNSLTMGACTASTTGCILDSAANNTNWTFGSSGTGFSNTSATTTRTVKMGTGTWTFNGTGNQWDQTLTTGLTFTGNTTSHIVYAGTSAAIGFKGGGLSYGSLAIPANVFGLTISGNNTFDSWTATAPAVIICGSGGAITETLTNAPTLSGTAGNYISLIGESQTFTLSVASGTVSFDYAAFWNVTGSGGATFTATNSYNLGRNSGITITGPSGSGGGRIIGG